MNDQRKLNTVNNFKNLNSEKLGGLTAKQLLKLIEKSWSNSFHNGMTLESADITWEEVGKIRIQIAKTIWKNFPEVAERKGLRKFN